MRPKDWIKVKKAHCEIVLGHKVDCKHCPADPLWCDTSFEAGADAMLKALWKMAEESPTKTFTLDSRVVNIFQGSGND